MPLRRRAPKPGGDVVALVRELGTLLGELGLNEIEVDREGLRVRVQRGAPVAAVHAVPTSAAPVAAPASVVDHVAADHTTIEAPMVGTFYRASSPTAEPYVREGDVVKQGQILCIIEAMKLMNEIESKVSGRIVKIAVENAQPVEYGQPLFLIDEHA
ncbi:MAG: acetyl-CoA carboxylase biotin carboxyl carrier protein [Candidatus Rokubacteria bacterium]|nr:acetyl-CoA carboxylase biotin carboxyl carrier protein [Candidatus Rokubacteria bacterium]